MARLTNFNPPHVNSPHVVFEDRGDPGANDYTLGAPLITDGTWYDLDLSAIVPAGAKAVVLAVSVKDDVVGNNIQFRNNGNTDEFNKSVVAAYAANITSYADVIVACDAQRIIEYKGNDTVFVSISVTIKGWFI